MRVEYKGFNGDIVYSHEDRCFCGYSRHNNDTICFEGKTLIEALGDFRESIENYIKLRRKLDEEQRYAER